MSENPGLQDLCWPVNWSCAPNSGDDIDPDLRAQAETLAVQTLRMLTAYQVGGCPITVRPCALRCQPDAYLIAPVEGTGDWMTPHLNLYGSWVNGCGCTNDCSCGALSEVLLPGPVGRVVSVIVDSETLDPTAYRVDNGNRLVRLDGDPWPVCQDMTEPPDGVGAFSVTYVRGVAPDATASYVAGLLAFEYAKACGGQECALPRNVTNVVRSGIALTMDQGQFPDGMTGIFAVDSWVRSLNPYKVKALAEVFSPDRRSARTTTWSGM